MNRYLLCAGILLTGLFRGPLLAPAAADEPLRVVPQIGWANMGLASSDGSLLVTGMGHYDSHSMRLVSKAGVLLWTLPLHDPSDAAFSPDGRWLAACGDAKGLLLDLKTCELRFLPAFRGRLVAFTPDSRKVLIVRRSLRREDAVDDGLFVFDLDARQVARFPVAMESPRVLEVLADGRTVRVRGSHGNPAMHVPRMGKAEEIFHLDTGKTERDWGPLERGWIDGGKDLRLVRMPAATSQMQTGCARKFYWNEASGLCMLGNKEVLDIRGGRFLCGLGQDTVSEVIGFLDRDTLLATTRKAGKSLLSLVNVRSGKASPIGPAPAPALPAPDGRSIFVESFRQDRSEAWLELYHVPPAEPVYRTTSYLHAWTSAVWSRDGQYLACMGPQKAGPAVRLISAADGRFVDVPLAEVITAHAAEGTSPYIWRLALDDSGGRLAVGMGWTHFGLFVIAGRKSRAVETVVDGMPALVNALQFVGPDRLLTGTQSGRVQLWDLNRRQPLWTTETQEDVLQFGYVPGGLNVVCGNLFRSGTVLRLKDGKLLYKSSPLLAGDSSVTLPWTQPQLIGHGDWALEMDPESMQVRLLEIAAGRIAMTYCALPDGQWIVYTPDGDWDGSARVHEWVKFCAGLKPLPSGEAEKRRGRERIEAVLKRVLANDANASPSR